MERRKLAIAFAATVFSGSVIAAGPTAYIGPPEDAAKQREVQSAAVYPQEGATSGNAAAALEQKRATPPALASTEEKQHAVDAIAVYPQEGVTTGRQAVKDRTEAALPPALENDREKQETVDAVTRANANP